MFTMTEVTSRQAHRGYQQISLAKVDHDLYDRLSESGNSNVIQTITVPKQRARAWELKRGQICRITLTEGSQVGDLNLWNLYDTREHFFSGKTRQIHRTHLSTYDRLWSCFPYLRPMATITKDSKQYGFDEDGMSIHDVIGTMCDPYMHRLMTGELGKHTCFQNLTEAIQPHGLTEYDVHPCLNVFMCSGFHRDTHEYMIKASPCNQGDYIEFVADMDLLVGLSACPMGDVSLQCGQAVPDNMCYPLGVTVGQPEKDIVKMMTPERIVCESIRSG